MISETTKNALSQLFEMGIEYMTLINHNNNPYFIVIGSTSILLMKEDFDVLDAKISFQCLDRLIVSSVDLNLFQIHFNNKRPKNVPNKMNIHSLERRELIKYIKAGWKTDYMFKFLEVRELPTYKGKFRDYNYQVVMLKKPQIELLENQPIFQSTMHKLNGYCIFLPSAFRNTKKGIYEQQHSKQNKSEFTLQVSDIHELEILEHLYNHYDLQYYAEYYVHNALSEEKQYWIIHSAPYFKRKNLYNDIAEWKGWQTRAKVIAIKENEDINKKRKKKQEEQEQEYVVIVLRRKYHPPYLENFTDIVLTFRYDPKTKFEKTKEQDQDEQELEEALQDSNEEEENENEGKNAAEDYAMAYKTIYSEFYGLNMMRDAADTIFSEDLKPMDQSYKNFLQMMANSLLYDEQWMFYLQTKHNIVPDILEILVKPIIKGFTILFDKNDGSIGQEDPNRPMIILNEFKNKIVKNMKENSKLNEKQKQEQQRIYLYKVSRYLALSLDGGIKPDFNFKLILQKAYPFYKDEVLKIFDFCLYSVSEQSGVSNDFLIEEVNKKFPKIAYQKYIYNERVMISFLQTTLLKDELLKKDQQQLYIDLLIQLLIQGKTTKLATCQHIVDYHSKEKDQITEQIINLQKALVTPLLIIYQSDHPKLSTYGCVALYNMCTTSKEFKYQIVKDNGIGIINNKLKTNNQNVLLYTLKLINSLMGIVQNIEAFVQLNIINTLLNIIQKNKIFALYSAQVLTMCLKIYNKCITREMELRENMTIFFDVIKLVSDIYFTEIIDIDLLKAEAIKTIFKICTLNSDDSLYCQIVQDNLMDYLIELLQVPIERELQTSIVRIMCFLIDSKQEFRQKWQIEIIVPIIEKFEASDPPVPDSDYLLQKLLSE